MDHNDLIENWFAEHFCNQALDTPTYNRAFAAKEALKKLFAPVEPAQPVEAAPVAEKESV